MIENKVSTFRGGITIKFRYEHDPYAETDYLGHFSSSWQPGAIDVVAMHLGAAPYRDTSMPSRYFIPADGPREIKNLRLYYHDHGYSKHEADIMSRGVPLQQYHRWQSHWVGGWDHVVLTAEVYYRNKKIETSSLCAIENDTDKDCLRNNELSTAADALDWVITEDCYSDTCKTAARQAKQLILSELEAAYKQDVINYAKNRWVKCPKQSGYAAWYDKNVA